MALVPVAGEIPPHVWLVGNMLATGPHVSHMGPAACSATVHFSMPAKLFDLWQFVQFNLQCTCNRDAYTHGSTGICRKIAHKGTRQTCVINKSVCFHRKGISSRASLPYIEYLLHLEVGIKFANNISEWIFFKIYNWIYDNKINKWHV